MCPWSRQSTLPLKAQAKADIGWLMACLQQQLTCVIFRCPAQAPVRCHTHQPAQSLLTLTSWFSLHLTLDQQHRVRRWHQVPRTSRMPLTCPVQRGVPQQKVGEGTHWVLLERPPGASHDSNCSVGHAPSVGIVSRASTMGSSRVKVARVSSSGLCKTRNTMSVSEGQLAQLLWPHEKNALPAVLTNASGQA